MESVACSRRRRVFRGLTVSLHVPLTRRPVLLWPLPNATVMTYGLVAVG